MALNQNKQNAHYIAMKQAQDELERLRRNQKKYNINPKTIQDTSATVREYGDLAGKGLNKVGQWTGNEGLANAGQKISDVSKKGIGKSVFNFAKDKISSMANTGKQVSDAVKGSVDGVMSGLEYGNSIKDAVNSSTGVATGLNNINNIANVADTVTDTVSNASNVASNATGAASKIGSAMPAVGTALGVASAGNNFAKGDYVNGALDLAKTGAMFIPGVGWLASGAIQIGQMINNAFNKKKEENKQKALQEAQKSTQASLEDISNRNQEVAQDKAENMQEMANNPVGGNLINEQQVPMTKPTMNEITEAVKPAETPIAQQPIEAPISQPETQNNALDVLSALGDTLAEKGNIDLGNRPIVNNQDGSFSTVKSMSFNDGNHEVLIPTISDDGTEWSEQEAIDNYYKTGNHLGKFNSIDDANNYAQALHNQQEKAYEGQFTGGAAPMNGNKNWFDDIQARIKNVYNYDQGLQEIPQLKTKSWQKQNQIVKPVDISKFTPEQKAAYDEVTAKNKRIDDMLYNTVHNQTGKTSIRQVTPTEQGLTDSTIPATPNVAPSQVTPTANASGTPQFDIIEPDGTIKPAQQEQPAQQTPFFPYQENPNRISDMINRAKHSYAENSNTGFSPENLNQATYTANVEDKDGNISEQQIKKNIWNKIGEFAGTGKRVLSNPLMQGLVAGALYRATGGNSGDSLRFGVDWANDKAKSDFYQKQLDPNAKSNVFGGRYTAEDWKNKAAIENAKATQQLATMKAENDEIYKKAKADELKMKALKEQHEMEVQKLSTEGFNEYNRLMSELEEQYGDLPEEKKLQKKEEILQRILAQYPSSANRIKEHNQVIKSHRDLYQQ